MSADQATVTNAETAQDVADLDRLGAELAARGYRTAVQTPQGQLPHLAVINPSASALAEKVYVQGPSYWWSWAERITGREDVTGAADMLARVLRAVSE
jgi:hypothetical protein